MQYRVSILYISLRTLSFVALFASLSILIERFSFSIFFSDWYHPFLDNVGVQRGRRRSSERYSVNFALAKKCFLLNLCCGGETCARAPDIDEIEQTSAQTEQPRASLARWRRLWGWWKHTRSPQPDRLCKKGRSVRSEEKKSVNKKWVWVESWGGRSYNFTGGEVPGTTTTLDYAYGDEFKG